jgi:hypothetical protein
MKLALIALSFGRTTLVFAAKAQRTPKIKSATESGAGPKMTSTTLVAIATSATPMQRPRSAFSRPGEETMRD